MTHIIMPGLDASDSLDFEPPISGFEYFNIFDGAATLRRNLINGKPALTAAGLPTFNAAGWAEFTGQANYLQSGIAETSNLTLVTLSRGVGIVDTGTRAMFISNFSAAGIGSAGSSIYAPDEVRIGGSLQGNNGGSSVIVSATETQNPNAWGFRVWIVNASGAARYLDLTHGIDKSANLTYPRALGSNTYRIGSSYSSSYPGRSDHIMAGILQRAITLDEARALYPVAQEVASRMGIAV
ncbi:hypothetical protein [Mycoplana rhizolycopersici]|uniref:Uncharacterized protein n=1 Tax=Mycoplana rhizolycopersici TaxID=2746702 RepID=A0ABX2QDW8_9HYPH|nr:hypothetical protein [Rhizobium rhizolycopersici]NVP55956.1 hypothetical protein [Rhizobium rhizolycopersici]